MSASDAIRIAALERRVADLEKAPLPLPAVTEEAMAGLPPTKPGAVRPQPKAPHGAR